MRLCADVRYAHRTDKDFRHITLVEEAHRLLSRPELSDSGARKAAVETFTDMLAEIRKYGEGLIIVDQIPNKLAPEVLKNTNTKIIHKIFARDDKDAVGDTMLMDDKQKEFLSALRTGQAIVFSENTEKPVHIEVTPVTDTSSEEVTDEAVTARFNEIRGRLGKAYTEDHTSMYYSLFARIVYDVCKCRTESCEFDYLCSKLEPYRQNGSYREIVYELCLSYYERTGKTSANPEKWREYLDDVKEFFCRCVEAGKLSVYSKITYLK